MEPKGGGGGGEAGEGGGGGATGVGGKGKGARAERHCPVSSTGWWESASISTLARTAASRSRGIVRGLSRSSVACATPFRATRTRRCCRMAASRRRPARTAARRDADGFDAFCIDRFEATLETLDGKPWSPYFNPGGQAVRALSVEGRCRKATSAESRPRPRARMPERGCAPTWNGCGLARGPRSTTYPYGDTKQPGLCNDARAEHPAIEYFATSERLDLVRARQCVHLAAPRLRRPDGAEPGLRHGRRGLRHDGQPARVDRRPGRDVPWWVLRGHGPQWAGCLYATTAHTTSHWDYSTGFRCCADAP